MQEKEKHQRRPHYSGRYPKAFREKYKELNPGRYKDAAAHILAKGGTPAGTHVPIMVSEILDFLDVTPGKKGLDCTLGYGGHTQKMLEKLDGSGHLYSVDADPIEIRKTTERLRGLGYSDEIWTPLHDNFRNAGRISAAYGPFDFVLADLGVSSMQIDNPDRGFSWKADGPLDLRFDPEKGEPASARLASLSRDEIEGMLTDNADEPYAADIARAIVRSVRLQKSPETTAQLREIVSQAVRSSSLSSGLTDRELKEAQKKSCMRVFQALRIDVNSEFEALYEFLEALPDILVPGGRVAILTFHSGEDRMVKKCFQYLKGEGIFRVSSPDCLRPTKEECFNNPRARSSKLRRAVRLQQM